MEENKVIETETAETEVVEKKDNVFKKVGKKVKTGVTNWLDKPGKTNREKLKALGTIGAVAGATALAFLLGKEVQKQESENLLTDGEDNTNDYSDEETAEIETDEEPVDDDFNGIDVVEF